MAPYTVCLRRPATVPFGASRVLHQGFYVRFYGESKGQFRAVRVLGLRYRRIVGCTAILHRAGS